MPALPPPLNSSTALEARPGASTAAAPITSTTASAPTAASDWLRLGTVQAGRPPSSSSFEIAT